MSILQRPVRVAYPIGSVRRVLSGPVAAEEGTATFEFDPAPNTQGELTALDRSYVVQGAASPAVPTLRPDHLTAGGRRPPDVARGHVAETLAGERVRDPTAGMYSPLWCARGQ